MEVSGSCPRSSEVAEEARLVEVDAQQLRELVEITITTPMPDLNPISTESEMKEPTNPRRSAPGRGGPPTSTANVSAAAMSGAHAAAGRDAAELGAGEDGDGRRGADAQRPRAADESVDHHRHDGGV